MLSEYMCQLTRLLLQHALELHNSQLLNEGCSIGYLAQCFDLNPEKMRAIVETLPQTQCAADIEEKRWARERMADFDKWL